MNAISKRFLAVDIRSKLESRGNYAFFGAIARKLAGIASFSAHRTPPGHIIVS